LAILDLFLSEMYKYDVEPHESLYLLETHCLKEGFSLIDILVEDMTVGSGDVAGLLITDIIGPKQKELKDPYREKKKTLEPDVSLVLLDVVSPVGPEFEPPVVLVAELAEVPEAAVLPEVALSVL
ncbi:MAG: hypothetical protein ACO3BW_05070, partial [Ilumatobacteraceae bacterium]